MLVSPLFNSAIEHPAGDIVMVEWEIDGLAEEGRLLIAPFHIHHTDEELFYVLSGQLGFEIGDEMFIASAGDAVLVPPGQIHSWWAASETPVRYMIVMPRRLNNLVTAIHAVPHSPKEMQQVYADHDSTLIGWTR